MSRVVIRDRRFWREHADGRLERIVLRPGREGGGPGFAHTGANRGDRWQSRGGGV